MIAHLVRSIRSADIERIHIVHSDSTAEALRQCIGGPDIRWVIQPQPLGTAHAALQALPHLDPGSIVIVLYGDNPFVRPETIAALIAAAERSGLAILTAQLQDASGFGRILRDAGGRVNAIVEHKDANEEQLKIREANIGPIAGPAARMARWLPQIDNRNKQEEFYLTDVVGIALSDGVTIETCAAMDRIEAQGVNSRTDQAALERTFQQDNAMRLMDAGVSLCDPSRFDLRGSCVAGKDCFIDINVVLEGEVVLGDNVRIGSNCVIRDSVIRSNASIEPNCVIDGAEIGAGAVVGPFARVRPGSHIGKRSKIGNFVEVNRSRIGRGSKANHLAYIGDSTVGDEANIGAGVVTCNYDGSSKHPTVIGDRAFVGSNSSLVAPIEIGRDAIVAAGSTLSNSVEDGHMAVERAKARTFRADRVRKSKKTN